MMRAKHRLVVLGSVLAFATSANAQPSRCPMPAEAAGGPGNAHTRYVEANLQPPVIKAGARPVSLAERMRQYDVPGLSLAVIHNGKLDWARGWGVRNVVTCSPVTPDTAFQAASISKFVTAVLALRMVDQGRIGLDGNIDEVLRSWHLPQDPRLAPNGVTLRQLLNHTAGLGVHGFAGYAPGSPLPTIAGILDGGAPANNAAVRSILPAGGQWKYSGGAYVLAQLALSDATGKPFAELAESDLLRPLGMTRSAYAQPPSATIRTDMASGHVRRMAIPGGYHVYPELAPAGLWTSAGDLARLLMDVQASAAGKAGHRLTPAMAREMLTPGKGNWGFGPALYTNGRARFGHDGLNEGFQSFMIAYQHRGDGIVVLTNGGQGRRLIDEVVRAVAADYGWIDIAAPAVEERTMSRADLDRIAGRFEGGGLAVLLEARQEGLFANIGRPNPERLIAQSETRFRTDAMGIVVEFEPDYSGFTIVEGGPPITMTRSPASPAGTKAGGS